MVLSYGFWQSRFQGDRGVVGRVVNLNKHPFTILGVAPPDFHGTLLFAYPDLYVPMVNQEQVSGMNVLNARGTRTGIFMVLGHLKPGVTPSQATADLNSVGSYLEKTYPKFDAHVNFALARPSLYGNLLGPPVRGFMTGLMLLAGLILLAACANLGSLFAARANDRTREVALRLALGAARSRVLRTFFTEAVLISAAGGALGLWASVALLESLSVWRPISRFPMSLPVTPDTAVYVVALALALFSAFLFGMVPVRQALRVDSYDVIKSRRASAFGKRFTARDLLLVVQIAICGVLVTSSLVAVRGLIRSQHSNFGFEPRNVLLMDAVLPMAGYKGEAVPPMQRRILQAIEAIPGVESVGLTDQIPLSGAYKGVLVFKDETTDLRQANAAALPFRYLVSPDYFRAAGTALLTGSAFSWHDDQNAPRVAVINRKFAMQIFGSVPGALGKFFKRADGTRIQVVGVAEDGKYQSLTEAQELAVFVPILQSPSSETYLVVRSNRNPQELAEAMRTTMKGLDRALPIFIETWQKQLELPLFPARMATMALGVLGVLGAMLSITGIFGMASYSVSRRLKELGIRIAIGAKPKEVLQAALGRAVRLLGVGSAAGLLLGLLAARVLAFIVYQATPRDPLVMAGVIVMMLLVGLIATWIPAQRALSIDPLKLLRED